MGITAAAGATSAEVMQLNLALQYLNSSPSFNILTSGMNAAININNIGDNRMTVTDVYWDPSDAHMISNSTTGQVGVQSAAVALAHELAHKLFGTSSPEAIDMAVKWEITIATELGEATRLDHGSIIQTIQTSNSTMRVENGRWVYTNYLGQEVDAGDAQYPPTSTDNGWGSGGGGGGGGGTGVDPSPGPNPSTPPPTGGGGWVYPVPEDPELPGTNSLPGTSYDMLDTADGEAPVIGSPQPDPYY